MSSDRPRQGQTLATGFALLKNLGLKEGPLPRETVALNVRPARAGLAEQIDGVPTATPLLQAVGAWRRGGPPLAKPPDAKLVGRQTAFCRSRSLPQFQAAVCRFHENFSGLSPSGQLQTLSVRAQTLKERIELLENEEKQINRSAQTRARVLTALQKVRQNGIYFEELFQMIRDLAANPELLSGISPEVAEYQQSRKSPFEVSRLALLAAAASVSDHDPFNSAFFSVYVRIHDWLFEVSDSDKLWSKFLKQNVFPQCSDLLAIGKSNDIGAWAKLWFDQSLLSQSNISVFFQQVAKPFLVENLEQLCQNGQIHTWVELATESELSSQFALIVRQHADAVLRNWSPPSPEAMRLLLRWPVVLGSSGDFLYRTIGPKLAERLQLGDIASVQAFLKVLPVSLSVSLIADSYLGPKVSEISKLAKSDVGKAVELYLKTEGRVPAELRGSRRIRTKLIECLDRLKERNSVLRGLKVEKEPESATIADLLEDIASRKSLEFASRGSLEGKAAYLIGNVTFGISDGVIWLHQGHGWNPILVHDVENLV